MQISYLSASFCICSDLPEIHSYWKKGFVTFHLMLVGSLVHILGYNPSDQSSAFSCMLVNSLNSCSLEWP